MDDQQQYLNNGLAQTREAARELARCEDQAIRDVLHDLADRAMQACDEILAANRLDLARMPQSDPKYDRLLLEHGPAQGDY